MKKSNLILLLLAFFLAETSLASNYEHELDSLLLLIEKKEVVKNTIEEYNIYYNLAEIYSKIERYDESITARKKTLDIARALDDVEKIARSLAGLGISYEDLTEYPTALEYFSAVLNLKRLDQTHSSRADAYSQMSSIYQALGHYQKAYEAQMKALQLNEANNSTIGIARSNYVIGSIFFYQKQFEKALEYYEKSKVICDELQSERLIYSCLAALGSVHAELGNDVDALYYNDQSLKLAEKLNYKRGIGYSLGNIGSNYLKQGNCKKAKEYISESVRIKSELNDNWGTIGSNLSLASVYEKCEGGEGIVPLMEKTIQMAKDLNSKSRELDAYEYMVTYYDNKKDVKKAYHYQKKYLNLKEEVLNEKTVEEMGQSKRRYEIQKKEHEISLLKKENELLATNKEIQKLQAYIFAIAILLFIIVSGWFITRLKYQRNINKLLGEKNNLLNSKNDEIHIKNKQLEHSNQDLQQFAYVASHDLKEPLRMINSYTSLLERKYHHLLDEPGKEFMHYIVDAVGRMHTLLDDLLSYSRSGTQQVPNKKVAVADIMVIVEANLRHRLNTSNGMLVVHDENLPAIKAHSTQLVQLLQNLVSNALKFRGEKDPVVTVDCKREDNQYVFSVQDNGIGISESNKEKVFEMFRRLHTREEYEGAGIGLATCKRIVSNMGGDIWVESEEGKGCTFFFSTPCPTEELAMA